jgi:hypothetical protein
VSHITKLIVTTTQDSTLAQFVKVYPYWSGHNYNYCEDAIDPDHDKWDIVVMSDGLPPANIGRVFDCKSGMLVIWLMHQGAQEEHRNKQLTWVNDNFPNCQLKRIPFSRGTDNDLRYFNAIHALCQKPSCSDDVYREQLTQLHRRLLGQDLTERAVTFMYSLALAMELKRSNNDDNEIAARKKAMKAVDSTVATLKQALALQGEEGTAAVTLIAAHLKTLYSTNVSVDGFRAIRNTLRKVCNA